MAEKVLGAPIAHSKQNVNYIDAPQFKLRGLDGLYDTAKQAFIR